MSFNNKIWKMDLRDAWFNSNRHSILNSLIKLQFKDHFKAHLTGAKGVGKSTLIAILAERIGESIVNMTYHSEFKEIPPSSYLIIDEAQMLSEDERQRIIAENPKILMVSVKDLTEDGYDFVYRIEDLTTEEVKSYILKYDLCSFDERAKEEIAKASHGRPRLINLLCSTALDNYETTGKITKETIEHIAKKKFKLRY